MNTNRPTLRHNIVKISKVYHKERIIKETRESQWVTYNEASIRLAADYRNFLEGKEVAGDSQINKRQKSTNKIALSIKIFI